MPEYRAKLFRKWYYAVWSDENGETQRRALRTKDHDEAERKIVDFRRDMAAPPGATAGALVQAYLDYKQTRVRDYERMTHAWKAAKGTFANLRPDQITPQLCEQYAIDRRAMGRGDATILKEINVIRQALNWGKVLTARFEAPSAPPPRNRWLNKIEARTLMDACKQPHVRLFVYLALTTAARKSAILSLTWDRVDLARKQIVLGVVGEKNRKGTATVPIDDDDLPMLEEAKAAAQTPYVIEYAGERVLNIKKGFGLAVARSGLENVTPHDLRHTAAVWMAEAGIEMDEIAQYLGHSDSRITFRVYARFSPTHLKKARNALKF